MFKNYFIIAVRNLLKNKVFSLINIIGLSLGIAVCIIILLFVNYEKKFDSIHTKNLYRLNEVQSFEAMANPQKRDQQDSTSKTKEAIAFVEATYKKCITASPFEYVFLDDHFATLYKNDQKVSKVVAVPGMLAGFISLFIALLSVSSQTFKTAISNPIKSLRTE